MPRIWALFACIFPLAPFICAQDLSLSPNDLRIEPGSGGDYHLFIRYKPDISSVLLTETTRDPQFRADNYAYRTAERNAVNGSEIRLIDGYPIPRESRIYSLVSSTPEWHQELGWAYHIYIPDTLYYGYEGGRHGEVHVGNGTYLNIRTFYYAYADYRGAFRDNPFMLQDNPGPPSAAPVHDQQAVAAFAQIAGGNAHISAGASEMAEQLRAILLSESGGSLDLVICLDTTGSMKPSVEALRKRLPLILQELAGGSGTDGAGTFRIGMVLFKDYYEEYLTKVIPFTSDIGAVQKSLDAIRASGGGDIPEAVYEGLHAGATQVQWDENSKKVIILIGDAPPHPRPRGRVTRKMAEDELAKRGIKVFAIVLPP